MVVLCFFLLVGQLFGFFIDVVWNWFCIVFYLNGECCNKLLFYGDKFGI